MLHNITGESALELLTQSSKQPSLDTITMPPLCSPTKRKRFTAKESAKAPVLHGKEPFSTRLFAETNTVTVLTPERKGRVGKHPVVTPIAVSPETETPSSSTPIKPGTQSSNQLKTGARRSLILNNAKGLSNKANEDGTVLVTDLKAKKRLPFSNPQIETQKNVKDTYTIVRRLTGSIGGNGSSGAIYGELTMGSMQKMINLMKKYTSFDSNSRFIDVGSGIGKPNIHVCQDPGVEFSYGIEMERSRWMLGMTCLKAVIDAAQVQHKSDKDLPPQQQIGHKCYFTHGNIAVAKTFDPFTHVYMFSIGFPPELWKTLASMFNKSLSPYLICYHNPKNIIEKYGFDVELLTQAPTSMHGSKEGHMGYLYRRKKVVENALVFTVCDPSFKEAWEVVQSGLSPLQNNVTGLVHDFNLGGRVTRSKGILHVA